MTQPEKTNFVELLNSVRVFENLNKFDLVGAVGFEKWMFWHESGDGDGDCDECCWCWWCHVCIVCNGCRRFTVVVWSGKVLWLGLLGCSARFTYFFQRKFVAIFFRDRQYNFRVGSGCNWGDLRSELRPQLICHLGWEEHWELMRVDIDVEFSLSMHKLRWLQHFKS